MRWSCAMRPRLLPRAHFSLCRQGAEALPFAGDKADEIRDRAVRGLDPGWGELVVHLGGVERHLQFGIHALDDRLRRAARREQPGPMTDADRRKTLLRRGRKRWIRAD